MNRKSERITVKTDNNSSRLKGKVLLVLIVLFGSGLSMQAQVTIGSDIHPPKAAILNLQTQPSDALDGVTSTKGGILLPRVSLVNLYTLEPFIATIDPEWNAANREQTKLAHKGLQVYNVNPSTDGAGVKVWDGTQWLKMLTDIPPAEVKTNDKLKLQSLIPATSLAVLPWMDLITKSNSTPLAFGTYNSVTDDYETIIKADGAYAFSFKIVADVVIPIDYLSAHVCTYIAIYKNNVMVECMEHQQECTRSNTTTTSPSSSTYTINTVLSINCERGDVITFGTGCYRGGGLHWVSSTIRAASINDAAPSGSTLTYWKL